MVTDSHDVARGAALEAEAVCLWVNLPVYSLILHSRFAPQFIKQGHHGEPLHARLSGQIHTVCPPSWYGNIEVLRTTLHSLLVH